MITPEALQTVPLKHGSVVVRSLVTGTITSPGGNGVFGASVANKKARASVPCASPKKLKPMPQDVGDEGKPGNPQAAFVTILSGPYGAYSAFAVLRLMTSSNLVGCLAGSGADCIGDPKAG